MFIQFSNCPVAALGLWFHCLGVTKSQERDWSFIEYKFSSNHLKHFWPGKTEIFGKDYSIECLSCCLSSEVPFCIFFRSEVRGHACWPHNPEGHIRNKRGKMVHRGHNDRSLFDHWNLSLASAFLEKQRILECWMFLRAFKNVFLLSLKTISLIPKCFGQTSVFAS